jgi:hypothetical protein
MLFLTYWEINENMSEGDRIKFLQKLMSSGLFPPKDVNILRMDTTPDGWGITLFEAQNAADVIKSIDVCRMAEGGFFKSTKTAPVIPVEEAMPISESFVKALG